MQAHKILKKYFGYDKFRPTQEEVIKTILDKKDCLVLMPTGGGKSITFQVPALIMSGVTIVLSPLIALMKDQVDGLKATGISAEFLNSSQTSKEQAEVENKLNKGELKLLYISPERLLTENFYYILQELDVSMFAIDEAHCISHWGHDFRPEYTKLKFLKHYYPKVPIIALTATADKITARDIIKQLRIENPVKFVDSFNRKNLSLNVLPGTNRMAKILAFVKNRKGQSGIIYCLSRKSTEDVAAKLQAEGIDAAYYHAKLPREKRTKVQEDFINDNVPIVCATIAFGMGIDKSNVRWVIHYNMPKNIENYYQEIGRSGRDGLKSDTLMFYSYRDVMVYRDFIEKNDDHTNREVEIAKLNRMQEFAEAQTCRRKILLSYFGEYLKEDCGNCDVCKNPPKHFDGTILAQKVLSAVFRLNEEVAMGLLIDFLRGSERREILENNYHKIKTHGAGREISYFDWQQIMLQLLNQGFIEIAYDQKNKVILTEASNDVLYKKTKVKLVRPEDIKQKQNENKQKAKPISKTQQINKDLFERLRVVRKQFAEKNRVAPYIISTDAALHELADTKPFTKESLYNISGMGELRIKKYGDAFLSEIINFVKEQDSEGKKIKGMTYMITYLYYKEGFSIEEIGKKRDLKEVTIFSHLANAYNKGKDVDVFSLISKPEMRKIYDVVKTMEDTSILKPIFEKLNEEISYGKIRLAISYIEKLSIK